MRPIVCQLNLFRRQRESEKDREREREKKNKQSIIIIIMSVRMGQSKGRPKWMSLRMWTLVGKELSQLA